MKKLLAVVLILVLILTVIPTNLFVVTASANTKSGKCGNKAYWELKDGVMTISGEGPLWDFRDDSDTYDYHKNPWENLKPQINKVVYGEGITYTGADAFSGCENLKTVVFSDTIHTIAPFTFLYCTNLENPTLPKKLEYLGQQAFSYSQKITEAIIPDTVTYLDSAFSECPALEYVYIGGKKDVGSYITGNSPFAGCTSLKKIEVSPNNLGLTAIDGVLYTSDKKILMQYPLGKKDEKYVICSSTQEIMQFAIDGSPYLESLVIPVSVKAIGTFGIARCPKLEDIYYKGTKTQWSKINFSADAIYGVFATKHFEKECKHKYSNSCDTECNVCKTERSVKHTYKNVITKATLTKNGKISYKCSKCGYVSSKTTTIKKIKSVKLSATSYTYNGKVKKPSVVVKDSAGKILKKNTDYTVSYSSGCKNVGTYKVTVKFKGKYSGTKTLTFKIIPPKTSVSKITAGKKALTVKVTKKTTQVSGYQIQYSTSKSFKSYKTATLTSSKKTSATIKKLTAKKTYYVRVRTYKTVKGKKYYSAWSTVKYKKKK